MNKVLVVLLFVSTAAFAQTGAMEGVVKTADGKPAAGVYVAVTRLPIERADDIAASAVTDGEGRFRIEQLAPAKYSVGAASAELAGGAATAEVEPGATVSVGITVGGPAHRVSGNVPGAWKNAHVMFGRWGDGKADLFSVPVRDGRYAIALPPGGTVAFQALADSAESVTLPLAEGDSTRDITLERLYAVPPPEVGPWIRGNAVALKRARAGGGLDDMGPVRAMVGDAHLVALGEATHGTKEFFQLKHRMLEYLVTEMGFTVFGIEASMPDTLAVEEYVVDGKGDPAKAVQGMGFWTWDTQEVLDMVKWMRTWNEEPKHARKLHFYGFDMQNPTASESRLRAWLTAHDAGALPLLDKLNVISQRSAQTPISSEEKASATAALDELARRIEANRTDGRDWLLARHFVELLRQAMSTEVAAGSYAARDEAMAANIRWLLDGEPAGTKMVVWAHNLHVTTDAAFAGGRSMGSQLRRMFGPDMVVFGFAFNRGSFQASGKGLVEHTVQPLAPGALDRTLAESGPPMFILDLRKAAGVVREWFDSPLRHRSIGAVYFDDRPEAVVIKIHPRRSFDALIFVDSTTSAVPVGGRQEVKLERPAAAAVNLDFAAGLDGWWIPPGAGLAAATSEGCAVAPCVVMKRDATSSGAFGTMMQRIDATPFRGKKVRFRARVRSELEPGASAQLWLRVDRPGGMAFLDNMMDRRPGPLPQWTELTIVAPVVQDADAIVFGLLFAGSGTTWMDEAVLEVVP